MVTMTLRYGTLFVAASVLALAVAGCAKEEPKEINLEEARKPDVAQQLGEGKQPSGAQMAKDAAGK